MVFEGMFVVGFVLVLVEFLWLFNEIFVLFWILLIGFENFFM